MKEYTTPAWLLVAGLLLASPFAPAAGEHPLEPVDTSSPRATLYSFLREVDGVWRLYREQYWQTPGRELSQYLQTRAARALRTLDLSEVAPSARAEVGYESGTYLYETLSRIELPPAEEIPDATAFDAADEPARWIIPHTDIAIVRITEGPRKGEFLFSSDTVARAYEFFLNVHDLPYRRAVPLQNSHELRKVLPGWWISMDTIEALPGWAQRIGLGHALWKWIAFAVLLVLATGLVVAVQRLSRRDIPANTVGGYLRRLAVPVLVLLLMPAITYLAAEQINLIGAAAKGVTLAARTVEYLVATWAVWLGCLLLAELIILNPRIAHDSLNAQLLRLSGRIAGIVLGLVILFYGANQIGLPIVGVLAGVGVSGLAIALAAQDSLKNLLGSLMIFMDQPYTPGQRIVVQGHDGFVEQIGLRSTKIRMLNGALTSIPNEKMASLDVENIGRRDFIRRQTSIRLDCTTSAEQIERAVGIIREILQDHEGMRPELPPRVFFSEFNPDSLNIFVSYWYHPPKRWESLAFDERVNLEILRRFAAEGIRLAVPTSRTYLTRDAQSSRGAQQPAG
jgi:MscS family membrane protein